MDEFKIDVDSREAQPGLWQSNKSTSAWATQDDD
jgi:hypothetical protein